MKRIKSEDLKSVVEEKYHKYLRAAEYTVTDVPAADLLNPNRIDLAFKLIYLKNRASAFAQKCYYEHIRSFTNGTFIENGNPLKDSYEKYLKTFDDIFDDIRKNGFDAEKSVILIGNNGVVLNGSHRLAISIFLNLNVKAITLDVPGPIFDVDFFTSKLTPAEYILAAIREFVSYKPKLRTAIVWPKGMHKGLNYADKLPCIFYKQEMSLSITGLISIVINVYKNEKWLGNLSNNYAGARNKALSCFVADHKTTIVLFENLQDLDLVELKENLRNEVKLDKHSIHMTDDHLETIEVNQLFLNYNLKKVLESSTTSQMHNLSKKYKHKDMLLGPHFLKKVLNLKMKYDTMFISRDEAPDEAGEHVAIGNHFDEIMLNPKYHIRMFGLTVISSEGILYLAKNNIAFENYEEPLFRGWHADISSFKRSVFYSIYYVKFRIKKQLKNLIYQSKKKR